MFEEPVDVHEYLTKVEVPRAPPMPIYPGGCSRSHGNPQRIRQHYDDILVTVLAEPDSLLRMRKLFYLTVEARNQWGFCGWQGEKLLPHLLAIPPTDTILSYLTHYAVSGLEGWWLAEKTLEHLLAVDNDIPLHCPTCGNPLASSLNTRHCECRGCHAIILPADFGESQWYKCHCGKMTHNSDELLLCDCGTQYTHKGLKELKAQTRQRMLKERIIQRLVAEGLPETALDEGHGLPDEVKERLRNWLSYP